jgi:hypothetical protein
LPLRLSLNHPNRILGILNANKIQLRPELVLKLKYFCLLYFSKLETEGKI